RNGSAVRLGGVLELALSIVSSSDAVVGLRITVVGPLLYRLLVGADGLHQIALRIMGKTEIMISLGKVALALIYGCIESGDRVVQLAAGVERPAQVAICLRVVRLVVDGGTKSLYCFLELAGVE